MKPEHRNLSPPDHPEISFVMPCYNEEGSIGYTIPQLIKGFEEAGYRLELVAVDNGSHDRTGEVIQSLAAEYPAVVHHHVQENQGYGHGILCGISRCTAPWVGIIPADGQVDAEDVVRLYEAAVASGEAVIAKVRRRFRMDGLRRKLVSVTYNMFIHLLWPRLGSIDVNGSPKIIPRDKLLAMRLESSGWLLDPELMIKGHHMGLRVLEFNVFSRLRGSGVSHVRPATCWEFIWNLLVFRFSRKIPRWQRAFDELPLSARDCVGR